MTNHRHVIEYIAIDPRIYARQYISTTTMMASIFDMNTIYIATELH